MSASAKDPVFDEPPPLPLDIMIAIVGLLRTNRDIGKVLQEIERSGALKLVSIEILRRLNQLIAKATQQNIDLARALFDQLSELDSDPSRRVLLAEAEITLGYGKLESR